MFVGLADRQSAVVQLIDHLVLSHRVPPRETISDARITATKPRTFYVPVNADQKQLKKEHPRYAAYFLNLLHWKRCC